MFLFINHQPQIIMRNIMLFSLWLITASIAKSANKDYTYVLVHGAWHGNWSYYKLNTLLESSGYRVISVNLPGHGIDKTDPGEVTLADYQNAIVQTLDTIPEPVVLVGHSMGGIAISMAAEARPEKVSKLVYIAAFMPKNGESMLDLAMQDTASLIGPNLIFNFQENIVDIKRDHICDIFYNSHDTKDIQLSQMLLTPNPLQPITTELVLSSENYGSIPKYYISTLKDKAVTPYFQYKMYKDLPFDNIFFMCTEHSPFFSAPNHLKRILIYIAEKDKHSRISLKSTNEKQNINTRADVLIYRNDQNSLLIRSNQIINQCNIKLFSLQGYMLDEKDIRTNAEQIEYRLEGINENFIIAVVTLNGEIYSRKILLTN